MDSAGIWHGPVCLVIFISILSFVVVPKSVSYFLQQWFNKEGKLNCLLPLSKLSENSATLNIVRFSIIDFSFKQYYRSQIFPSIYIFIQ